MPRPKSATSFWRMGKIGATPAMKPPMAATMMAPTSCS